MVSNQNERQNEQMNVRQSSKNRDHMSPQKRAKQFMPFSAVSGLEKALRKKEMEFDGYDTVEHVLLEDVTEDLI